MKRLSVKKANIIWVLLATLCALLGLLFSAVESRVVFAETQTITITQSGPRLIAEKGNSYVWLRADAADGEYTALTGKTSRYYDIGSDDVGQYFKVVVDGEESEVIGPIGNLYVFDLAKKKVSFGTTVTGVGVNGEDISVTHQKGNIYVVQQSNNTTSTKNGISVSSSSIAYDVTLDGINIYETFTTVSPGSGPQVSNYSSCINIPANTTTKVVLRIKGENSVRGIHYYTQTNKNSSLKITDINGDGETSGYLYVPKKVAANDIDAFMASTLNHNHWNAGIGGDDGVSDVRGLTFAGANVQVLTTAGDNCTAIGAGGNGYAEVVVTGGNVYAACNGTGAAIGGGIGWNSAGGQAIVTISGGTVYAKNYGNLTYNGHRVGGVAIGGGSSFHASGAKGTIKISGGTVSAYGTFGNGMGGGNSSTLKGGEASVTISGGVVTASSIGGGNSQSGDAGKATVHVEGTADITLVNGIGGGNTAKGRGGDAEITVDNGSLKCGTNIGGGNGGNNGNPTGININGGDAKITINGGTLTSKAIGGGRGAGTGNGGGATVIVTGGKMTATTIGGGQGGANGGLGNATADISGGEIKGQFIMAQGANPCTFTMTGGTLYGVDTSSSDYTYKNGGAVYIEDANGKVHMSGGSIQGGVAENGGAIYLGGGDVYIYGGSIENNTAKQNGGGVYVGNGNFYMEGGSLSGNIAVNGEGGGAYVQGSDHIRVSVRSGIIENNKAALRGGAIAIIGNETTQDLVITLGSKVKHFDENGNAIACDHKEHGTISQMSCPVIRHNQTTLEESEGGAFYITGNYETHFNTYCLVESGNTANGGDSKSNFMKVDGGKIVISSLQDDTQEDSEGGYGNVVIGGSFYVKGGQVELKGSDPAPEILGAITVDIKQGTSDYFRDERVFAGEYHTVQYFEDFQSSGQYTVYQILDGAEYTIAASMYGHSGYAFDGWSTKDANGNYDADYEVGVVYIITQSLRLYAKWNANVYFVVYSANVPPETTYQGAMEQSQFAYDQEYNLTVNAFQRKGYQFQGWALTPESTVISYLDGALVINLAESAGDTVTLYAVWIECVHGTFVYAVSGNVMTRSCVDCEMFEETAKIVAKNAVYDGLPHEAEILYSGAVWAKEALTLVYTHQKYDSTELPVETNDVVNAGYYTASFTYDGKTAIATFEIDKATQAAPAKPDYQDMEQGNNRYIQILTTGEKKDWQIYEFRIGYVSNGQVVYQYNSDPTSPYFVLDKSFTNYFVYVRFAKTDNYYESAYKQADSVYFFAGNITLKVVYGEGVDGLAHYAEQGSGDDGISIVCTLDTGYYRLSSFGINESKSELSGANYSVNGLTVHLHDIANGSTILAYIDGAKRGVVFKSTAISNGEVFGDVSGTSANIGNDSAYTVFFSVEFFEGYSSLALLFSQALPEKTTILLIDKTSGESTFWYYRVGTSTSSIVLTSSAFTSMIDGSPFRMSGTSFVYQFIIDFSGCAQSSLLKNSITTALSATSAGDAPNLPEHALTTSLQSLSFAVDEPIATTDDSSAELTVAYAKTQEGASTSKWEERSISLVLTAADTLPLDSAIEVSENGKTTVYYQTDAGYFILPLSITSNSIADVRLSLKSDLVPSTGGSYTFNGALYASYTSMGKSPLNGEKLDEFTIVFSVKGTEDIALKIDGEQSVCTVNGTLTVQVTGNNSIMSSRYQVTADIMKKNEQTDKYETTGRRPSVTLNSELSVSFAGLNLEEGSYCLMVSVKDTETGSIVMRVPYYFILYGIS